MRVEQGPHIPHTLEQQNPIQPAMAWSRRKVLRYLGGGAAALGFAAILGRRQWEASQDVVTGVRVSRQRGQVLLKTASGRSGHLRADIQSGSTLATIGTFSSAVVSCPDGTEVSLTGDSEVALPGRGTRFVLLQGTATANVPSRRVDSQSMIIQTAQASLARLSDVLLTLARTQRGTEVGVQNGVAAVDSPTGQSWGVVRAGEILTVRAERRPQQAVDPRYSGQLRLGPRETSTIRLECWGQRGDARGPCGGAGILVGPLLPSGNVPNPFGPSMGSWILSPSSGFDN